MKRVIVFLDNFDTGGVTSVVRAIYRGLDRNKFRMDFARRNCNINEFDEEVKANGDNVFYFNDYPLNKIPLLNYKQKQLNISRQIQKQIKNIKYDAIHIHAQPVIGLHIAKKIGIPVRIMHTHESIPDFGGNADKSLITRLLLNNRMCKYNRYPTVKAGDSLNACKAKFGDAVVNDPRLQIIYPPVDMEKFNPKAYCKDDIIKEFDIDTSFFNMVHVGRLNPVKNQSFMIDVLKEINKIKPSRLYIIGDGDLKDKLKAYAKEQGMEDNVIFLPGNTTPGIYTAMDCSLLPSFSEAFGMVAVESQLMDVPCFASDNVPKDVDIGMCSFMELDAPKWAYNILNYNYDNAQVNDCKKDKFSIDTIINQVSRLYNSELL